MILENREVIVIQFVLKNPSKFKMAIAMKGYNQTNFAKHIHVSKEYLSNVLNGRYNPSPPTARKLASGIGKKIPDIFFPKMCEKVKQKASDNQCQS